MTARPPARPPLCYAGRRTAGHGHDLDDHRLLPAGGSAGQGEVPGVGGSGALAPGSDLPQGEDWITGERNNLWVLTFWSESCFCAWQQQTKGCVGCGGICFL